MIYKDGMIKVIKTFKNKSYHDIYLWINPVLNTPTLRLLSTLNIIGLILILLINIIISRLLYLKKSIGNKLIIIMNSIYILISPFIIFGGALLIAEYNIEIILWFAFISPVWYAYNLLYYISRKQEFK
jgi:hypothetical protein